MGFESINSGFSGSGGGGGGISGGGTLNRIAKFTGATSIGDSQWEAIGNDVWPITTGSNIGDDTHRIGTIFMASTFDYASDLTWVTSASEKMRLTTTGDLLIGTTSDLARLTVKSSFSTSATYTAQFHNSTGTSNSLVIRDDGHVGINCTPALIIQPLTVGTYNVGGGNTVINGDADFDALNVLGGNAIYIISAYSKS